MKKILAIGAAAAMMLAGCATNQPAQSQQPAPEPVKLVDTSVPNVRISYSDEQVATALKAMNVRLVKDGRFPKLAFQLVNFTQAKGSSSKTPVTKPDGTKMFRSVFLNDARRCCFFYQHNSKILL